MDYSVVIPAYNEAAFIGPTLEALNRAMAPLPWRGEIVVADNRSTDETAAIARRNGARVVREPVNQISRARNTGARAATGRLLLFVDADTLVPPALLALAVRALSEGRLGGGGATIRPDRPLPQAASLALTFWNRVSTAFGLAAGSFVFCIRKGFDAVGGFDERLFAAEEIFFSIRYGRWCREAGLPFSILRSPPVVSSARKLDWYGPRKLLLMVGAMVAFPVVARFKPLCRFWYRRPDGSG